MSYKMFNQFPDQEIIISFNTNREQKPQYSHRTVTWNLSLLLITNKAAARLQKWKQKILSSIYLTVLTHYQPQRQKESRLIYTFLS